MEIYNTLNTLLERTKYIADDNVTIADFCVIACISTSELIIPIDEAKFPKLAEWVKSIKQLPCYNVNLPGLEKFKAFLLSVVNLVK